MTILRRLALVAAGTVLALSLGRAQAPRDAHGAAASALPRATPASVGLAPAPIEEATALLKQFVAGRKIAGAVAAIARHGKVAYLESVGVQVVLGNTYHLALRPGDELIAEILRRDAEIESGAVKPIPYEQAMREIRESLQ